MKSQKEWRLRGLAARDTLSGEEVAAKNAAIGELLMQLLKARRYRCVMFYASFRSEVGTGLVMAGCLARGIKVALPLSLPASHRLQPRLVSDLTGQLRPGYCAIPEPDPALARLVSPREIEAVIVPGSVFDLRGGRIGYGGGFYDRFLAQEAPQAVRIGLAFAVQVQTDDLPLAPHDQRLDMLVTEDRVYAFPGRCFSPVPPGVQEMNWT